MGRICFSPQSKPAAVRSFLNRLNKFDAVFPTDLNDSFHIRPAGFCELFGTPRKEFLKA
jgi:hypothetical protein